MKKNKKLFCMKKALPILFALLMIPCISFAEALVINFESDALGKVYPCVTRNNNDISAVIVEKDAWSFGKSLHIFSANWGVCACPKFTVTLPEGKTLADVKEITFDIFLEGIEGTDYHGQNKSYYCMFGEKGSSSLVSDNLEASTTSPLIGSWLNTWEGKRFVPTIPDSLLSLNQFDWAFGLEAPPCDYYLDNITFTFFTGEFDIIGGASPPGESIVYQGHTLWYVPQTYVKEGSIINPYKVLVMIDRIPEPTDITYSLYTYKPTFSQQHRRYAPEYGVTSPSIGAFNYGPGMTFSTQKDIDDNLDLIYTFPPIKETETGYKFIDWNGKTSDGRAVRDCVLLAAHDSTGKLLNSIEFGPAVQGYAISSYPDVKYTPIPGAVRAEITLAWEKPVRRIWGILGEGCALGSPTISFDIVNQGGPAIAEALEAVAPNEQNIFAVAELKNPKIVTGAKDDEGKPIQDGLIKIFTWDITGAIPSADLRLVKEANQILMYKFLPQTVSTREEAIAVFEAEGVDYGPYDRDERYNMIIVLEADDGNGNIVPTFTGLNDGYIYEGELISFPMQGPLSKSAIIDFESDEPGAAYPAIAWSPADITAVVENNPAGEGKALHVMHKNWGSSPRFTVTFPEGITLADIEKITFDLYFQSVETVGDQTPNSWKGFNYFFGETGASFNPGAPTGNTGNNIVQNPEDNPAQKWLKKEFVPTIPTNLHSLNRFDFGFGMMINEAGNYFLDNITFLSKKTGIFQVKPVVSPVYNREGGIGINASNEKVTIYGIDGRLVKQVVAKQFIPLPRGLYIVKVGTANAVKVVVK